MINLLFWMVMILIGVAGLLWYMADQSAVDDYYDRINEILNDIKKQ